VEGWKAGRLKVRRWRVRWKRANGKWKTVLILDTGKVEG